jgi:hypothetical protein
MSAGWAQALTGMAAGVGGLGVVVWRLGRWAGNLEQILATLRDNDADKEKRIRTLESAAPK